MFDIPRSEQKAWKKFAANCFPLSEIIVFGGPYLKTHVSKNAAGTV